MRVRLGGVRCLGRCHLRTEPLEFLVQRRLVCQHRRQLLVPFVQLLFQSLELVKRLLRDTDGLRQQRLVERERCRWCLLGVGPNQPETEVEEFPRGGQRVELLDRSCGCGPRGCPRSLMTRALLNTASPTVLRNVGSWMSALRWS